MRYALSAALVLTLANAVAVGRTPDGDDPWTLMDVMPAAVQASEPWIRPVAFKALQLDDQAMRQVLANVPLETFPFPPNEGVLFRLPHPDGGFATFRLVESPVMEPGLQQQFPDVRTYRGQGVDDPTANVRLDMTPLGFHAMVLSAEGTYFIDPYSKGDVNHYAVYYKHDYVAHAQGWHCDVTDSLPMADVGYGERNSGTTLKTYRVAVAATGEYTAYFGGTVAAGQAAIVSAINRVTGVYERDCCIRLVLVANNSSLVYTNASTDPYTNTNGSTMLGQNQTTVTSIIGSANYDIGHVFSTGGGGVALLGCVCNASTKAQGVTGSPAPNGDAFWIDYVAHEMGHQFGGNHTFNGTGGSCAGGNRNASTAYEPGSGTTIMGYAGICGASDDLQAHSDALFHHQSYAEIRAYIAAGGSCGTNSATGNTVPTVNGGVDYTIPKGTAFTLTTLSAGDANGDALTYSWEERDLGAAATAVSADNGTSPIMRCWDATTSNSRTFPRMASVLSGTTVIGEQYPALARTFKARVTVRDNRSGGGGVIEDDVNVNINGTAGPFAITSPNTNVTWSGTQTVTWNVASTNLAPISTAYVNILLSTDGGVTWPTVLAASTANDGSEAVALPFISSSTARIRVEAVGNIYFDVSNVNFTLQGAPPPAAPTGVSASPSSICGTAPVTLTATVGTGETVDWYTGGCGATLVGSGSPLTVNPTSTTTYYARARNISTTAVSTTCSTTSVTLLGSAPAAPTNVAATDSTLCSASTVTFTASAGASSYQVFRSLTNDIATATQVGTPTASPFSDSTGTPGQPYYYWVKAVGGCGVSAASLSDVGTRKAPPATPADVAASDGTACGTVSITFTPVTGATGYQIFRNSVNDSSTATQVAAASGSPATDLSAPLNTPSFYWVRASNTCGVSPLGGGDTGYALGTPAAPANVVASDAASCLSVNISWSAVPGASNYSIYRNSVGDQATASLIGTSPVTSYADTTAAAATTYFYWVRAENTCGNGALGGGDAGSRSITPGTPTGVAAADGTSCNGVLVTWNAIPGATSYGVLRNVANTATGAQSLGTVAVASFNDATAAANQTYYYFVYASNACGTSGTSVGDAGLRGETPAFSQHPSSTSANQGDSVTLTAVATGSGATYQWRLGGIPVSNNPPRITGATTGTLVINPVQVSDAGDYDVVASTSCGTVTSTIATLTLNGGIPCPADFNQDGGVDGTDVSAYFIAWEQGANEADVNQDGGVDGSDIEFFFRVWEAGGC